jgi:hypothetical protein
VEGDQAGAAVGHDVRSEEHERIPVAGVDGQVADELLIDGLRDLGLLGVDERRGAADIDLGGDGGVGQRGVDREDLTDGEDEILTIDLAEAAAAEDHFVVAGGKEGSGVRAVAIGGEVACGSGIGVDDDDGRAGNDGSGGVGDSSGDVAGTGGLRAERQNCGASKQRGRG